jgi:hypothetical protein
MQRLDAARLRPHDPVNDATIAVYFEALGESDYRDLAAAVSDVILDSPWFPTPAELHTRITEHRKTRDLAEREHRAPVGALPFETGDPEENRKAVRALLESLRLKFKWGESPVNASGSTKRG